MTESSYMIAPGQSQGDLDMRRKLALALHQQAVQPQQIEHWTQGLAQLANAGITGWEMGDLDRKEREETAKGNELMAKFLMGNGGVPASPPPPPTSVQPAPIPATPVPVSATGPKPMATALAADPAPVTGPRPGGPVQPTNRVWGDAEAEAAGLYEKPAPNARMAQALMPPAPQTAPASPAANPGGAPVQPVGSAPPANREMIAAMLANRKTAPMAQAIIKGQIEQQFKPSEYDFKDDGKGGFLAINKKNPSDVRPVGGDGKGAIEHAAAMEAAKTAAKLKAERDATAPQRTAQEQQTGKIVTDDIDRALAIIKKSPTTTTGTVGPFLSKIGGTDASNVRSLIDTVKANAGFNELSKMRQASPTGAALGAVTERELALLQATIGNMEQSQDAAQLEYNLRRVKNIYADIIHGEGKGPPREKLDATPAAPAAGTRKTKSGVSWSVE